MGEHDVGDDRRLRYSFDQADPGINVRTCVDGEPSTACLGARLGEFAHIPLWIPSGAPRWRAGWVLRRFGAVLGRHLMREGNCLPHCIPSLLPRHRDRSGSTARHAAAGCSDAGCDRMTPRARRPVRAGAACDAQVRHTNLARPGGSIVAAYCASADAARCTRATDEHFSHRFDRVGPLLVAPAHAGAHP